MFTCITSLTKLGALLRRRTRYKMSPLSFKSNSSNCRYSKELNELVSSAGGMISANGIYAYKQQICEMICAMLRT